MIENYEAFRGELRMSKEDVIRDVYRQNKERISIKKEATAVKNLTRIIDSTAAGQLQGVSCDDAEGPVRRFRHEHGGALCVYPQQG